MAKNDINYQALANEGNPFIEKPTQYDGTEETTTDTENEDGHRDGIMIHVVPDTSKGMILKYPKSIAISRIKKV